MSSEKVPKYIYAQVREVYYDLYHLGGNWENNKTEKKWQQNNISFIKAQRKTATNTVMALRFGLAAYIVRLFDSHFSLVYFSGLQYILARKMLYDARQRDNDIYF